MKSGQKRNLPPSFITSLLRKVLDKEFFSIVSEELKEDYEENHQARGAGYAKTIYFIEVLGFIFRNNQIKAKPKRSVMNSLIPSFFKTSIRSLQRRRAYFLFNLLGLSVGLASGIAILKFVYQEYSYDNFHSNDIYRVIRINQQGISMANSAPDLAPEIQKGLPEISKATRFFPRKNAIFQITRNAAPKNFKDINFLYADDSFLSMFSFSGKDQLTALAAPNSIVLTERLANKMFGDQDVVGKSISFKDPNFPLTTCVVTAVVSDVPKNSHFKFDALVSMSTPVRNGQSVDELGWSAYYSYIQIQGRLGQAFNDRLAEFEAAYFASKNSDMQLGIQPLKDIHLHSDINHEIEQNGDARLIRYFLLAAIFIFIMAYINYMNLATAQSVERSKEIGVRKVLGSNKTQISMQFFVETVVLNFISLLVAFLLIWLANLAFTISAVLPNLFVFSIQEVVILVGFILVGTFLSALYPGFILSRLKPIATIHNKLSAPSDRLSVRSVLTVLQFTISLFILIGTLVITNQLNYMMNYDEGIDMEQMLIVDTPSIRSADHRNRLIRFRNNLFELPFVSSTSTASTTPGLGYNYSATAFKLSQADEEGALVYIDGIDAPFVDHYGLTLLSGRSFDDSFSNERSRIVINKSCVNLLGFASASDAISEKLLIERDTLEIIGVIDDYNHKALKSSIDPQVMVYNGSYVPHFSIKMEASSMGQMIENMNGIEASFLDAFPNAEIDYFFLDQKFDEQYENDKVAHQVSWYFTVVSLVITVVGLLGFISFILTKSQKEIAIRRILGAAQLQILYNLSRPIFRMWLISVVLAIIGGIWFSTYWLNQYAFRVEISPTLFGLPSIGILMCCILIVIVKSMGIISKNPSEFVQSD